MVSKPLGIAIHRIPNQPNNPRILVADNRNSRLLIVRLFAPSISPWTGSPCGSFHNPSDVATHWATRNVFVADTDSNRILKFTPSSTPPGSWPCSAWGIFGSDKGQFNGPVALAIDNSSGDVYVSDKGNNRIQKFNGNGEFIMEFNNFWSTGMAVDLDQNVYVSVAALHKVFKFTPDFKLIPEWDPVGTSAITFRYPHGIAVDRKNDVYVVDSGHFEVKKISEEGVYLPRPSGLPWGGLGTSAGKFRLPYGITYDVNIQRIFVSDSSLHRIQIFNEDGSHVDTRVL